VIQESCFQLVHRKDSRRTGTAVLVFPGLVPTYSDLEDEAKILLRFGDVLEFHYPETKVDIQDLYQSITQTLKELKYKRVILFGVSFGGTLVYLLLRYWKHHRIDLGVKCFVAMSTPFQPENLTPMSQFKLDFGKSLDQFSRKIFVWLIRVLRWLFFWSPSHDALYARENSFRQVLNALWVGNSTLGQNWLVKQKLLHPPALLLNTRDGVIDRFVKRENEVDFLDVFPRGRIIRGLGNHANIKQLSTSGRRELGEFIAAALRG